MFALYKKEIGSYLNTPLGYIPVILFALVVNFLFVRETFITGAVTFPTFFTMSAWAMLIFVPALVMRSFSEEKRQNTIEILLSLPLNETGIVLAKYLAYVTFLLFGLLLTAVIPITFVGLTNVYLPEVFSGYLGVVLLGSSFIAVSMFYSSLTKNQIISFLGSVLTLFLLVSLSVEFVTSLLPSFLQDALTYIGPLYHLQNFVKGIIDFRSLWYFISMNALFIFLTVIQLEKRD